MCWFTFNTPAVTNESGLLIHPDSKQSGYSLVGNAFHIDNLLRLNRNQGVVLTPNVITNNQSEFTIHFIYLNGGEIGSDGNVLKMAFTNLSGGGSRLWTVESRGYAQETFYDANCLLFYRDTVFSGANQLLFAYTFNRSFHPAAHVTLIYKPYVWTLFINGKFMGDWRIGALSEKLFAENPSILFGYSTNRVGYIDDVMVFNKALNTNEVAELLTPPAPRIGRVYPWAYTGHAIVQAPNGNFWTKNVLTRSTDLVNWNAITTSYGTRPEMLTTGIHLNDYDSIMITNQAGSPVSSKAFYSFHIIPWDYGAYPPFNSPEDAE